MSWANFKKRENTNNNEIDPRKNLIKKRKDFIMSYIYYEILKVNLNIFKQI